MIPLAIPALMGFGKSWWKAAVGAAVIAGPVFLMGQCSGAGNERKRSEAAIAVAVTAATTKNSGLLEKAGEERAADVARVQEQTERLTDAIAAGPDETPGAVAVRASCERLRADGQDVSALSQCAGPQARGQAPANR
jgi:hypothetical protein